MELLKTKGMKTLTVALVAASALLITVLVIAFRGASIGRAPDIEETLNIDNTLDTDGIGDIAYTETVEPEETVKETDPPVTMEETTNRPSKNPTPSLDFVSNGDGTCSVSGIGSITSVEIDIPTLSPAGDIVTGISEYAFYNCTSIVSITIPSTVRTIGKYAFLGCSSLLCFTVSSSNTAFKTLDHILYSKDGSRLIACPAMRGKTSCVITTDVVAIENGAFSGVSNLKNVYYTGTAAEWTKVEVGSNNEVLESVRLTCNYKE